MKKSYKIILIAVMSIVSLLAIFMSLDLPNMNNVTTNSHLARVIINFSKSLPSLDISHFFIFIFIYYFYYKFYFDGRKTKKSIIALSIFLALTLIFGYSFYKTNSWDLIFGGEIQFVKSIIKLVGYSVIIYILLKKLYDGLEYINNKEEKENNKYLQAIFYKHPNIFIVLILVIVWLPIFILFFPGIPTYDGVTQINQLLGEYQEVHVNLINPDVVINNHHPILSTLIIGLFINIGNFLGCVDVGIYLYVLAQTALLIYVILYSFKIMRKMKTKIMVQLSILIFYAICPLFIIFSMNVLKDVLFGICVFYYILLIIEMLIDKEVLRKKIYILKIILTLFLIMMFRNNGIYTILLSFPFLLIVIKEYRKQLIIALAIPVVIYITLNKIVYPILQITPGSIKEMLSIPFQQTARTLYEGKEYEQEDLEKINKILDVDAISKNYNPILSDPVKNTFNKNYEKDDLINYFGVWFKYLFKYPDTYVEATLNNSYAYLYPNKSNLVGYCKPPEDFVKENPLDMKYIKTFQNERNVVEEVFKLMMKAPITGTLLSAGFNNWMLLILAIYTLLSKHKKFIIPYLGLISILLVCIASPYFAIRYMLSVVYCMPVLIALSIYISKKSIEE